MQTPLFTTTAIAAAVALALVLPGARRRLQSLRRRIASRRAGPRAARDARRRGAQARMRADWASVVARFEALLLRSIQPRPPSDLFSVATPSIA